MERAMMHIERAQALIDETGFGWSPQLMTEKQVLKDVKNQIRAQHGQILRISKGTDVSSGTFNNVSITNYELKNTSVKIATRFTRSALAVVNRDGSPLRLRNRDVDTLSYVKQKKNDSDDTVFIKKASTRQKEAEQSEDRWIEADRHGLSPKLYAHAYVVKQTERGKKEVFKMIVSEAMDCSLKQMMDRQKDVVCEELPRAYQKWKDIPPATSKAIKDMLCKLYDDTAGINITCMDTKPHNVVVCVDINDVPYKIRLIDWDADFCVQIMKIKRAAFAWLMKAQMALLFLFKWGINPFYEVFSSEPPPDVSSMINFKSKINGKSHASNIKHYLDSYRRFNKFFDDIAAGDDPRETRSKDRFSLDVLRMCLDKKNLLEAWKFFGGSSRRAKSRTSNSSSPTSPMTIQNSAALRAREDHDSIQKAISLTSRSLDDGEIQTNDLESVVKRDMSINNFNYQYKIYESAKQLVEEVERSGVTSDTKKILLLLMRLIVGTIRYQPSQFVFKVYCTVGKDEIIETILTEGDESLRRDVERLIQKKNDEDFMTRLFKPSEDQRWYEAAKRVAGEYERNDEKIRIGRDGSVKWFAVQDGALAEQPYRFIPVSDQILRAKLGPGGFMGYTELHVTKQRVLQKFCNLRSCFNTREFTRVLGSRGTDEKWVS